MPSVASRMVAAVILLLGQLRRAGQPKGPVFIPTPQMVDKYGYVVEEYNVTTQDGYVLTLHRMPPRPRPKVRDKDKERPFTFRRLWGPWDPWDNRMGQSAGQANASYPPVMVQHGLMGSSADWTLPGPPNGLPYILVDAGYDVWLGNTRGNVYSRKHTVLDPVHDKKKFWNFSWHEMGVYDVPAIIGHVLRVSGCPQLFYVGHSMGTTMYYVMGAERPEYNDKVRAMFSLAPVAYMGRVKSPIRYFAPAASDLTFFMHLFGHDEFLPQSKALRFLAKVACELITVEERVCENAVFILVGFDANQFNTSMLPVLLSHSPAGASTKTLAHYAQEINSGKFRQYDYGKAGNMAHYGHPEPPAYNISKIRTPISLHFASNDWLANIQDVEELSLQLPNVLFSELVPLLSFNHLDFLLARDVPFLVYDRVQQIMDKLQEDEWNLDDI